MIDLVLYHGNCNDGFCAAWLMRKAFPDVACVGVRYGQSPPGVSGRNVAIVDFSYKRDVLLGMKERAASLVVLDHHKSAAEDLAGLDFCEFDMGRSGARMAWDWLRSRGLLPGRIGAWEPTGDDDAHWLVEYVQDRDLWRHKLAYSRAVNAAIASREHDFAEWDAMADGSIARLADEGVAILRYQSKVVRDHVRNARPVEIAGHEVLAVNATCLFSEIAGELAEGRPFGACYFDRQDGKRQFSLRSREGGLDVSEIARLFGGGGHASAAGFEITIDGNPGCTGPVNPRGA